MLVPASLLLLGVALVVSGWKDQNIVDTFKGLSGKHPWSGIEQSAADVTGTAAAAAGNAAGDIVGNGPLPQGVGYFDGHAVAKWMITPLKWARQHGWGGSVISGIRSPSAQLAAAADYARRSGRSIASIYPNGPLASNHVIHKRPVAYPEGAVDVTEPQQLAQVLTGYPGHPNLVWAGPTIGDDAHFSANGH